MQSLSDFQKLIASIPIGKHSVEVKRENWKSHPQNTLLAKIFNSEPTIRVSRSSIFRVTNLKEKCVQILLWGYPKGMRGNHRNYIFKNLDDIIKAICSSPKSWDEFYHSLHKNNKHLGISTITKLAYFYKLKFKDGELPALILDSRIIKLLVAKQWRELKSLSSITYNNADKKYVEYLQTMQKIARDLKIDDAAKLEFFLFQMGNTFIKNAQTDSRH